MSWFKSKTKENVSSDLKTFQEHLVQRAGENLESIILYGSLASGEFQDDKSDVNVFILLKDVNYTALAELSAIVRDWMGNDYPMPVIMETAELMQYAQSFPIEFLDMKDHHRVLVGTDVIAPLIVPNDLLKAQTFHELSMRQMQLRRSTLLLAQKPKELAKVFHQSLPSVLALLRAALRLQHPIEPMSKKDAAKQLLQELSLNVNQLNQILTWSETHPKEASNEIFANYLDLIEDVLKNMGISKTLS